MAGVFDKGAEERYAGLAHVRMPEAAPVARAEQTLAKRGARGGVRCGG